jgi:hypothetical protein
MADSQSLLSLIVAAAIAAGACGPEAPPPPPPPTPAAQALASALAALPSAMPAPATPEPPVAETPAPEATASEAPPPTTTLSARPSPLPPPTTTLAAPSALPKPVATPTPDAARVASLLVEAEAALGQQRWAQAESTFGQALQLDPGSARAKAGRDQARGMILGLSRSFVNDLPNAESEYAPGKPAGFDDVEELDVKKAAQIPGRAEIEVAPARVKPGDPYTVKLYLRNTSRKKRTIKIKTLNLTRSVNGQASPVAAASAVVEVKQKQRALLASLTGAWEPGVEDWELEVRVLSERGDVYQNRVVWK